MRLKGGEKKAMGFSTAGACLKFVLRRIGLGRHVGDLKSLTLSATGVSSQLAKNSIEWVEKITEAIHSLAMTSPP